MSDQIAFDGQGAAKGRIFFVNTKKQKPGPVVYWMSREQRVNDNWGLLYARQQAGDDRPLIVVFSLVPSYPGAALRQYDFMLRGLKEVETNLKNLGIPFYLLTGDPYKEIPAVVSRLDAGAVVTDFDPLRIKQHWQTSIAGILQVPLIEVDGHNVIPARQVSDKQEYAARTIRPKIHRLTLEYLENFPALQAQTFTDFDSSRLYPENDWEAILKSIKVDESVKPVRLVPGESAAQRALENFVEKKIHHYAAKRNDPNAAGTSALSAYFHFGHLAPQRAALVVMASGTGEGQEAFLEELVVRRELSENFCLHNSKYDSLAGAPQWALKTLDEFRNDHRKYTYSFEQFEKADTHSSLWNAAQNQMLQTGYMHGYMRMFWAKKILEWSSSPEEAHSTVITLNDRYLLDGRDPNGYVGALWSMAGLHDRPWKKRPVFGSVRYMNENGCRRKFDVDAYCKTWNP